MAFQYTILTDQRLILARFEGPASLEEFKASAPLICSDSRYTRDFDGLLDLTEVKVSIDLSEVWDLVRFTEANRKEGYGKWAVIVTTPVATAFAMVYRQRAEPALPFLLFSTYEGAADYLEKIIDKKILSAALAADLQANKPLSTSPPSIGDRDCLG